VDTPVSNPDKSKNNNLDWFNYYLVGSNITL
jgi:hypothetical protein